MVLHFRDGAIAYVNDVNMGVELAKVMQSGSRIDSTTRSSSPPQSSSTSSISSGTNLKYDRASLLRSYSTTSTKCSVKNTFLHVSDDENSTCSAGAASAPASFEDVVAHGATADLYFMGDTGVDTATQTIENNEAFTEKNTGAIYEDKCVQSSQASTSEVGCSADQFVIVRETERARPDAGFRGDMQKEIDAHQARHPGGTLPSELCCFSDYMDKKKRWMNDERLQLLKCHFCGKVT